MKNTHLLLMLVGLISCSNFKQISIKIDSNNKAKKPFISQHDIRMILFKNKNLDFIDFKSDTIFLVQNSVDLESLNYSGYIFNKNHSIYYNYNSLNKKLETNSNTYFATNLVQKWDTTFLRKSAEYLGKNIHMGNTNIKRIILKNENIIQNENIELNK